MVFTCVNKRPLQRDRTLKIFRRKGSAIPTDLTHFNHWRRQQKTSYTACFFIRRANLTNRPILHKYPLLGILEAWVLVNSLFAYFTLLTMNATDDKEPCATDVVHWNKLIKDRLHWTPGQTTRVRRRRPLGYKLQQDCCVLARS